VLRGDEDNYGQSALVASDRPAARGGRRRAAPPQFTERFGVISDRLGTPIVGVERTLVAGPGLEWTAQHVPQLGIRDVPGLGRSVPKRPKQAMAGCSVWSR
jgi:hypothetical protein